MINSIIVNFSPNHNLSYTVVVCQYFMFSWWFGGIATPVTTQMSSEFAVINVVLKEF